MSRFIVSLDLETGGLDRDNHSILMFSAMLEDLDSPKSFDETPKFTRYIDNDLIHGSAFALNMNAWMLNILGSGKLPEAMPLEDVGICKPEELALQFSAYLIANGGFDVSKKDGRVHIIPAGKNVAGFDLPFLNNLDGWKETIQVAHRLLDPAVLYFDFSKDKRVPSMPECCTRASVTNEREHHAIFDCWAVIELLRPFYGGSAYGSMIELVSEYNKLPDPTVSEVKVA